MTAFITYFVLGFTVCTIGALPFGAVNLSVVDTTLKHGKMRAMQIALGAAFIEIIFALTAFISGSFIQKTFNKNPAFSLVIIFGLVILGLLFFFKKNKEIQTKKYKLPGILNGIFLNLISIQVLLFWTIAIPLLSAKELIDFKTVSVAIFIIGVFFGKIIVLRLYVYFSKKIVSQSVVLSKNINKIIGIVLLLSAVIQIVK